MKCKIFTGLIFMALTVICFNAKATDELNHNPFEQPKMMSERLQTNTGQAEMKLRGTVIDGHDSMVNINGKFYRFNEEVAGYRIVGIARKSVTLRRGISEMVLILNENE